MDYTNETSPESQIWPESGPQDFYFVQLPSLNMIAAKRPAAKSYSKFHPVDLYRVEV